MRRLLVAVTLVAALAAPAAAAIPEAEVPQMTAVNAPRDDGAEYVWRVFCNSGLRYNYIPATQFPVSSRFVEVTTPQTGDIAWWPEYVAIFVSQNESLITQTGMVKLAALSGDGSHPRFFRMKVMPDQQPGEHPATGECERNLF
jgi:hypothetical protein